MNKYLFSTIFFFLTLIPNVMFAEEIRILPTRVGQIYAIHDFWYAPNSVGADEAGDLGFRSIKLWPTESIISSDMIAVFNDPRFDVLIIRPLENAVIEQSGCVPTMHFRWENTDYGREALKLYEAIGHLDKTIILTTWESDWQLKGLGCTNYIPNQEEREEYRRLLDKRQKGVQLARNQFLHKSLRVYFAVEVNDALGNTWKVIDHIAPAMNHTPDFIAYSSWETNVGPASQMQSALDYIANKTNLPRHRIFVGELGWPENQGDQYQKVYNRGRHALLWGVKLLYYWGLRDQFEGAAGYWTIRPDGSLAPAYDALKDLQDNFE